LGSAITSRSPDFLPEQRRSGTSLLFMLQTPIHQGGLMDIRPFQAADAEAVSRLWQEVFPDDPPHNAPERVIAQKLAVQPELFFVADENSIVIGTVLAGYDGHRGWLYAVAVSPQHRRQGIGKALVCHAENALTAIGCPKINLQVRTANAEVLAFYERLGYCVEERISLGKRLI
jgi:ribosomal protein S18 acetylase RimI-like enzyme